MMDKERAREMIEYFWTEDVESLCRPESCEAILKHIGSILTGLPEDEIEIPEEFIVRFGELIPGIRASADESSKEE